MATHDQYRPMDYSRQNFASDPRYPPPPQQQQYAGPMTMYQPPSNSMAMAPSSHPQAYEQNPGAFEPAYDAPEPRRSSSSGRESRRRRARRDSQSQSDDERRSKSYAQKLKTTGGPLAGAASGALLGASLGGKGGHRTEGTLGGMVLGTFAGGSLERAFKNRRQEKGKAAEKIENHAQKAQDRYDEAYTKVAYAAPGYGSSLLPSDTSHGGTVNRNSQTTPVQ